MKYFLIIPVFFYVHCKAQDSLNIPTIDSIVYSIDSIIKSRDYSRIIPSRVSFLDWKEEYIFDKTQKRLLNVNAYTLNIDTMPVHHPFPGGPKYFVDTNLEFYSYYYFDDKLIKVIDHVYRWEYYRITDQYFTSQTGEDWPIDSWVNKKFLGWSRRYLLHYKTLF